MTSKIRELRLFVTLGALIHLGASQAAGIHGTMSAADWVKLNPELEGATFVNSSGKCVECHQEYIERFSMSRMGRTLPQGSCESCHGPMSKHLEAPRRKPALVVSFKKEAGLTSDQTSSICLQCHQDGLQLHWSTSTHAAAGNTCINCHNVMAMEDPVRDKAEQPGICFNCHMDKRAELNKRSHHPVMEGKVVCSDCHNPHGSAGPHQLAKNTVNEVCYQCHAEKRGPFLWEHQPVREDCTNCHNPHGTNQPRMLAVREPWLCQQCHGEAFHPSTFYNGEGIPPNGAAQQLLGRSCTNCHSVIHGSNHPSGSRFTR